MGDLVFGMPIKGKNKRQPISISQKNEILARQKNRCAICKKLLDMRIKHFDHIKEVYKGGKSKVNNLQALCLNCHAKKTHKDRLRKVESRRKKVNSGMVNPLSGQKVRFL